MLRNCKSSSGFIANTDQGTPFIGLVTVSRLRESKTKKIEKPQISSKRNNRKLKDVLN